MRPPGHSATSEPFGELITGTRPDLSTRNGQLRFLVAELGVTRQQAQALIRAYVLDQRDAERMANMSHADLARLMAELPLGMRRGLPSGVRAIRAEPKRWRVAS